MLFWSFVLSFVMVILFYALYPRTDQITIVDKPQAEAAVMAFVNSHQSAKKMIYNFVDDYDINGKKVYTVYIPEMKKVAERYDNPQKVESAIFEEQTVPVDKLGHIRPGLITDVNKGIKGIRFEGINSAVACIKTIRNENGDVTKELTFNCCIVGETASCPDGQTEDYVITYADHPTWWDDTTKSKQLWRNALLKRSRYSNECGVLYPRSGGQAGNIAGISKYDPTSRYVLDNSQRFVISIPKEITGALDILEGGNMSDYLFCITPVKNILENAQKEVARFNSQVGLEETTTME